MLISFNEILVWNWNGNALFLFDKIISNKDKFITTITEPMIVNFVIHNPKLKEKIG